MEIMAKKNSWKVINLYILTFVVFNLFYSSIESLILRTNDVFKHHDLQMFDLQLNK